MSRKRTFFEKLTGSIRMDDRALVYDPREEIEEEHHSLHDAFHDLDETPLEEQDEDGELAVDVYHTGDALVVKAMTSGVQKGDLDISITRESIVIRGSRLDQSHSDEDSYFYRELYWGTFSRTIMLPEEIDVDTAKAHEEHGLLTITLPLIDKNREAKLKVH